MNETLMLAASGRICREYGMQTSLLEVLCDYGADPRAGLQSAVAHQEFDAVRTLIDRGAPLDLPTAAALNDKAAVARLVQDADADEIQLALALAANAGRDGIVTALISAGADPIQYNPPGGHSHCTALHSAVAGNHLATVVGLVEGGADIFLKDIHHNATALEWAEHMKHDRIAEFLKSKL